MAKVIITYGVPMDGFHSLAGHELICPPAGERFSKAEMLTLLPNADAVLCCSPFDREMIESGKRLKLIVCYGAGYDAIDVAAATEHGIMVANTPDCVTAPTAELAIAHLMGLARGLVTLNHIIRTQPASEAFVMGKQMGMSLEGATLGIIGMGRIGGRIADFGHVMGMRVLYSAKTAKPNRNVLGDVHVPLHTLMTEADFISVHCPHTPETHGLISKEMLALMKPTAFLINTARGFVVDEAALLEVLSNHKIAGAGLDVFVNEPNVNPAFFALDNVLLTPHVGSNTERVRRLMGEAASERILDVLSGKLPMNLLNPEAVRS